METREIFDAAPLSVFQFLSAPGQGLYIPPYQRAYTWEISKVKRLLSDVAHGLERLSGDKESICFLGTVIALKDTKYSTITPVYRDHVPGRVMTIIDGQQRLTTLLLLVTVLHEEIRVRSAKMVPGSPADHWAVNQAKDVTVRLANCYEEDMRFGDQPFYPKLIRAYNDVWSRNAHEAYYRSPIGNFLQSYGAYARDPETEKAAYKQLPIGESRPSEIDAKAYEHLEKIRNEMRVAIRRAVGGGVVKDGDMTLPVGSDIAGSDVLQVSLFNNELPSEIKDCLREDSPVSALSRLVVFANFLLSRVTVVVVTAKREDDGFDMFEALNTTGQALTAIETFKPRVIEAEGIDRWQGSPSKRHFDAIESYLEREGSTSADRRQSVTSNLLIPFALLQDGDKIGKRLNDQRGYLRNSYNRHTGIEAQREFLATLVQVVRFYENAWQEKPQFVDFSDRDLHKQAGISLAVLKAGGHDIVIAPLVRYFAAYRLADGDSSARVEQFLRAARACAAFYGIWRGAYGGTHGIDSIYRTLMASEADGSPGFARKSSALTDTPPVELFQQYLRGRLERAGLATREDWVARASKTPVFSASKPLTRLLLLAASEDTGPDEGNPGLISRGRRGLLQTLDLDCWQNPIYATVEHIAPQAGQASGWASEIYRESEILDRIGNLTLLPTVENSSVSNREWQAKRIMYEAFSVSTVEEAEKTLVEARSLGVDLGKRAEEITREAHYLPLVAALAQKKDEWTPEYIDARSVRLCSLAWDSLAPWLGL
ncbi:DUF262 domain-containing HNH endonuclease family protein [Streptomyces griseoviridis]|jgi:hypothetical protein|uniref:DUF262 domain-containing protein n=1 Tax=Streptomyces griseoviridis TaxID=45398 RepID=A0A918LC33_STRGD|nr:DUF262 domain-containing HNH endonuclease family protein [Streptomyces niveoruber]GGS29715.1 hypothetical protein GCM10010238_18290 [Streptomyces niveoruber]